MAGTSPTCGGHTIVTAFALALVVMSLTFMGGGRVDPARARRDRRAASTSIAAARRPSIHATGTRTSTRRVHGATADPGLRVGPNAAGPRRLLGLAVRRLAGPALPRGPGQGPLARALLAGVRHGRGQLDLLQARLERRGRALGRADAAGLRVRRQGQPLHDPHQAAPGPRGGDRALLRRHRAARRVGESSARSSGSSRRTSSATTTGSAARYPCCPRAALLRVPRRELVRRAGVQAAARARRRTRHRRPPALAVPGARAHHRLDARPPAPRAPRPRRQLLGDRDRRVGRAHRRLEPRGRGARLLQQRLEGLRPANALSLRRRLRRIRDG